MGISGKFILLLFVGCLIPLTAIFTNLEDWLNNRQSLELFKERNRYHELGKSFESLFSLYLKGINELSTDYSKALDKYILIIKKRINRLVRSILIQVTGPMVTKIVNASILNNSKNGISHAKQNF